MSDFHHRQQQQQQQQQQHHHHQQQYHQQLLSEEVVRDPSAHKQLNEGNMAPSPYSGDAPGEVIEVGASGDLSGAGCEVIEQGVSQEMNGAPVVGVPSEAELLLLCLDYMRDLRRAYTPADLLDAEGIRADYLTVAIYSLTRCFDTPQVLTQDHGNDPFVSHRTEAPSDSSKDPMRLQGSLPCEPSKFPSLDRMTREVIVPPKNVTSAADEEEKRQDGEQQYDNEQYNYDDSHASNAHRFYLLNGLASGPSLRGPLQLGEVVWAGLSGLQARSRVEAEQEMITSPLFEQFVEAVKSKGFFKDAEHETPREDPNEEAERQIRQRQIYDERFAKVVSKFRTKLASKAQIEGVITSAMEWQQARRFRRIEAVRERRDEQKEDAMGSNEGQQYQVPNKGVGQMAGVPSQSQSQSEPTDMTGVGQNPVDFEEAEKLKALGNAHMQKKEYQEAATSYTKALQLSPSGPNSHVYFSNRAAALLSMKKFDEAILDSERSLALKPNYGKAHARLGLAHFLLGDYRQAMEAYTVALKYEPDNKSSKSYLEKAAKRLAAEGSAEHSSHSQRAQSTSFSVVSEWDKARSKSPAREKVAKPDLTKQFVVADTRTKNDSREAEKYKVKGNSYMANRQYDLALIAYSSAIELCPSGNQSHVYYSNRAAALCYLERYQEAEKDSVQSLKLKPTYGKAHARLGLSRFFLNNYEGAVKAYTAALEYDPENAASKSYLSKAKLKLERQRAEQRSSADTRRLLDDPEMHLMARKALANPNGELFKDPEMQNIAKKAMSDPTMMEAVMAVPHVQLNK